MNNWKIITRDVIYRLMTQLTLGMKSKLIVLCYHSFDSNNWRFSVSVRQLDIQLKKLAEKGSFINAKNLLDGGFKSLDNKFLITIDDGYHSVISTIKVFDKYNVKPLLFVIADTKNVKRTELDTQEKLLTISQIKSLIKSGWMIGCHSMTHPDFQTLSSDQISLEIIESKKLLEKKLGIKIDYFAYPKGAYNREIVKAVKKAGYKLAFTMDDDQISTQTDTLRIPRVGVDSSHQNSFSDIYSVGSVFFRRLVKSSPMKGAFI